MASYFGDDAIVGTTRTNSSFVVPASAPTGAISLIYLYIEGDTTPTPPAGYTQLINIDFAGANAFDLWVWWKRLGAGEGGTTHTVTHASQWTSGVLAVVQNPSASINPVAGTGNQGTGTTATALSVTPTGDNAYIGYAVGAWGGWVTTPPAGTTPTFTEQYDANTNMYYADGTLSPAGATGNKATTDVSDDWIALLVVVEDVATSGVVPDPGHRRRALPPDMRRGPRVFRAFVDAILTPGPVGSGELLLQSVGCLSDVANVTVAVPAPLTLGTVPCLSDLPNMTVATPARLTLDSVPCLSNLPNMTVATPAPLTLGTVPCVSDLANVSIVTPARLALDTVPCVSSLGNVALATPAPLTLGAVPTLSNVANVAVATPAGLTLQAVACTSSLANITITTDPPPPAVGGGFILFKAAASG